MGRGADRSIVAHHDGFEAGARAGKLDGVRRCRNAVAANLEEYAFNTDPLAANTTPIVSASLVATNSAQFLAMTFPLVTAASDIIYRVEASAELQSWLPGCTYSGLVPKFTWRQAVSGAGAAA